MIQNWKTSDVCQELQDALEKIDFSSCPDGGKITLESSPIVCPGRRVRTTRPPHDSGTVGCLCNDNLTRKQYAITCAHVVGAEDVDCLVSTGQGNEPRATLGKSDVVIK